jgi:hypothetical protein
MACDESSTAGVPASGVDYERCDSATHKIVQSLNGSAESPLQTVGPLPIAAPAYYNGTSSAVSTWTTNAQTDAVGDFVLVFTRGYAGTPPVSLTVTSTPSETWTSLGCATGGSHLTCTSWAVIGTAGSHTFTTTTDGGKTTTYASTTTDTFTGTMGTVNAYALNAAGNLSPAPIPAVYQTSAISPTQRTLNIVCVCNDSVAGTPFPGPFLPGSYGTMDNSSNGPANTSSAAVAYDVCEHYITTSAINGLVGQAWMQLGGTGVGVIVAVNY